MTIERILCPTDFSETSAHAVEYAAAMGTHYHAAITAQHVVSSLEPWVERTADTLRQHVAAFFNPVIALGLPLEVVIDAGQPAHQIVERASRLHADLIVIGTHGASGFEHFMLGSVTEKVLRKAPCPVLTVPPRAQTASRVPPKRVLCAVDFSDASLTAVRFASSLTSESGSSLTLLHVLQWPWHEPPAPSIDSLPPEQGFALAAFRRDAEERARTRLDAVVAELTVRSSITTRLASGTPYEQILEVSATEQMDLIVLGVGSRSVLNLALLGSTTNHVVREATCSVLTVRMPLAVATRL